MKSGKFKNWCLKEINHNFYVYSWHYRPKAFRTPRRKQRYYWRYRGKFGSKKAKNFFRTLPEDEQKKVKLEYERLVNQSNKIKAALQELEKEEPFKSDKIAIMKITNSKKRRVALKHFNRRLKNAIKTEKDNTNRTKTKI